MKTRCCFLSTYQKGLHDNFFRVLSLFYISELENILQTPSLHFLLFSSSSSSEPTFLAQVLFLHLKDLAAPLVNRIVCNTFIEA